MHQNQFQPAFIMITLPFCKLLHISTSKWESCEQTCASQEQKDKATSIGVALCYKKVLIPQISAAGCRLLSGQMMTSLLAICTSGDHEENEQLSVNELSVFVWRVANE